jgi:hypothetical protein
MLALASDPRPARVIMTLTTAKRRDHDAGPGADVMITAARAQGRVRG